MWRGRQQRERFFQRIDALWIDKYTEIGAIGMIKKGIDELASCSTVSSSDNDGGCGHDVGARRESEEKKGGKECKSLLGGVTFPVTS